MKYIWPITYYLYRCFRKCRKGDVNRLFKTYINGGGDRNEINDWLFIIQQNTNL